LPDLALLAHRSIQPRRTLPQRLAARQHPSHVRLDDRCAEVHVPFGRELFRQIRKHRLGLRQVPLDSELSHLLSLGRARRTPALLLGALRRARHLGRHSRLLSRTLLGMLASSRQPLEPLGCLALHLEPPHSGRLLTTSCGGGELEVLGFPARRRD
jgi:hypothetical protein